MAQPYIPDWRTAGFRDRRREDHGAGAQPQEFIGSGTASEKVPHDALDGVGRIPSYVPTDDVPLRLVTSGPGTGTIKVDATVLRDAAAKFAKGGELHSSITSAADELETVELRPGIFQEATALGGKVDGVTKTYADHVHKHTGRCLAFARVLEDVADLADKTEKDLEKAILDLRGSIADFVTYL